MKEQKTFEERYHAYCEMWKAKPWWDKLWSHVYHRFVLWQYPFTGWLPCWLRELLEDPQ